MQSTLQPIYATPALWQCVDISNGYQNDLKTIHRVELDLNHTGTYIQHCAQRQHTPFISTALLAKA